MSTELIYALFWFSTGAFLHHLLTIFRFIKEKEQFYSQFVKNMVSISSIFSEQFQNVVDIKRSVMKEMGLDDEKIDEECVVEDNFLKNWKILYTTTVLNNIPRDVVAKILKKEVR